MGLTLAATAKTSVLIPDRLWHSGVGAAAAHRGPLSASHHLSMIKKKQSEAASPLLFEIFEPKLQKSFRFQIFWSELWETQKFLVHGSHLLTARPHIAAPQLVHWSSSKERIPESIAKQRQEFETRLKEQAPKIRDVNARFELKKLSIPTIADSQ